MDARPVRAARRAVELDDQPSVLSKEGATSFQPLFDAAGRATLARDDARVPRGQDAEEEGSAVPR